MILFISAALAAAVAQTGTPSAQDAPQPQTPVARDSVHFAVIGDYGNGTPEAAGVAAVVKLLNPQFIITVGDNNYPLGDAATIDANIGALYHEYIGNYQGSYGAGSTANRFFPSLGNHDWYTAGAAPYLAYFTLPGNERYYNFQAGPVELFALDSDPSEPDGVTAPGVQGQWLQQRLAASTAPFKFVYDHHPPYSSASGHGSTVYMQWPFRAWGANAVFSGHDHCYERLSVDGVPYVVSGFGGQSVYGILEPSAGSQYFYGADFGFTDVVATKTAATFRVINRAHTVIDMFAMSAKYNQVVDAVLVPKGSVWKYLDGGAFPGAAWTSPSFDDSAWASGPAQLGYGDGDEATVVGYGSDRNNKFITTWFRRQFTVANPSQFAAYRLRLRRDDGAVVYLNGAEVFRSNMPAGAVAPSTLAVYSVPEQGESNDYETLLAPAQFAAGVNTFAVELHQAAPNSSDLSFDFELQGVPAENVFIPFGAVWKYRDTGAAPPAAWTGGGYDDSAWPQGPAQLGYGDGDEATVVGFGPNAAQKYITTWFRRKFTVPSAVAVRKLILRILRDDGVAIYINGKEAYRENLPFEPLTPAVPASANIAGADESAVRETSLDPGLLHDGENVIAVEIHQSNGASSDLSFDMSLSAR